MKRYPTNNGNNVDTKRQAVDHMSVIRELERQLQVLKTYNQSFEKSLNFVKSSLCYTPPPNNSSFSNGNNNSLNINRGTTNQLLADTRVKLQATERENSALKLQLEDAHRIMQTKDALIRSLLATINTSRSNSAVPVNSSAVPMQSVTQRSALISNIAVPPVPKKVEVKYEKKKSVEEEKIPVEVKVTKKAALPLLAPKPAMFSPVCTQVAATIVSLSKTEGLANTVDLDEMESKAKYFVNMLFRSLHNPAEIAKQMLDPQHRPGRRSRSCNVYDLMKLGGEMTLSSKECLSQLIILENWYRSVDVAAGGRMPFPNRRIKYGLLRHALANNIKSRIKDIQMEFESMLDKQLSVSALNGMLPDDDVPVLRQRILSECKLGMSLINNLFIQNDCLELLFLPHMDFTHLYHLNDRHLTFISKAMSIPELRDGIYSWCQEYRQHKYGLQPILTER